MPHDLNNEPLAVGDVVSLDCRVKEIMTGEKYCNVLLETILPPNPPTMGPCTVSANSCQVIKCRKSEMETPTPASSNATAGAEPKSEPTAKKGKAGINR